jgi:hypothetical protein
MVANRSCIPEALCRSHAQRHAAADAPKRAAKRGVSRHGTHTISCMVYAILLTSLGLLQGILPGEWRGGYAEIATVSILFGAVGVGSLYMSRALRPRRETNGLAG